jgi:DeoR family transcriptional regulator, aga operon transcriptional repressor
LPAIRDTSGRRQKISVMMRESGSVQVAPLAAQFGVSMQTIRKDLHFLSEHGVAARSYGGAISAHAVSFASEPAVEAKLTINIDEKQRIGRMAAAMVQPGDSIVLDSGTTTLEIARHLPGDTDITVVTNDFGVLAALSQKNGIKIIMLGGELRRKNMAFYGGQTVDALNNIHVDKLFLGVDGFDLERGITTHHEPEAMLNRKMAQAARAVIAVTDSSKFGRVCLHRILAVGDLDALVTDNAAPDYIRDASAFMGFALHLA